MREGGGRKNPKGYTFVKRKNIMKKMLKKTTKRTSKKIGFCRKP